jgi:RNA polymerase sigma-70 factor (ECF subfamily)
MRVRMPGAMADAFVAGRVDQAPLTQAAFADFYARTAGPLGGYVRRLTGHRALAEDLVHEAYVRFLSLVRVPATDDHRRNYLFRIATNLARDHFRRAQRDHGYRESLPAPAPARDWSARRHLPDRGELDDVLAGLSTRDRELLLLAYVEGLTHREISAITGLMRASVKPLLFRARRRFAAALREAGLGDAEGAEPAS